MSWRPWSVAKVLSLRCRLFVVELLNSLVWTPVWRSTRGIVARPRLGDAGLRRRERALRGPDGGLLPERERGRLREGEPERPGRRPRRGGGGVGGGAGGGSPGRTGSRAPAGSSWSGPTRARWPSGRAPARGRGPAPRGGIWCASVRSLPCRGARPGARRGLAGGSRRALLLEREMPREPLLEHRVQRGNQDQREPGRHQRGRR